MQGIALRKLYLFYPTGDNLPCLFGLYAGSGRALHALAALTTILGMIPLLPDAMFGSLAASIMGGLTFGTLITLLFIPVLYALFFHIKNEQ